jgi:Tfp pilus assembly protein PilO
LVRTFGGLSARSQRVVFSLLTLSVLLGAWHTWLGPARLLFESRRSKRDQTIAELARLRLTTAALPALQREVQALEEKLAEQGSPGPDAPAQETLLEAAHGLATQSGLELISFAHPPAPRDAAGASERVQLGLEGGFHDVVAFLARLGADGRLGSAPDLTIKPQTKPAGRRIVTVTLVADVKSAAPIALPDDVSAPAPNDSADPFLPPAFIAAGAAPAKAHSAVAAGLSGISANDVAVTGIVRSGDVMSAILQAPDRRTFVVRPQDQLLDGVVKSVDSSGVVFGVRTPRAGVAQSSERRKTLPKRPGAVR